MAHRIVLGRSLTYRVEQAISTGVIGPNAVPVWYMPTVKVEKKHGDLTTPIRGGVAKQANKTIPFASDDVRQAYNEQFGGMLEPFDLRSPWMPVQSDAVVAKVAAQKFAVGHEDDQRAAAANAIAEEYAGVVAASVAATGPVADDVYGHVTDASPAQTENQKNLDDGLNAFIELIHQTKGEKDS